MGNHSSCHGGNSVPVKSIISTPCPKINVTPLNPKRKTEVNRNSNSTGKKSQEVTDGGVRNVKSPDDIKTKRSLSNFFGSPRPRDGAVQAMAATGGQIMMASQKIPCNNLEKFAKHLVDKSEEGPLLLAQAAVDPGISKTTFQDEVFPHSRLASEYLWSFFTNYAEDEGGHRLTVAEFTAAAEHIYAQITDKEQVKFYVKIFARDSNYIDRTSFRDFLLTTYQLDFVGQMITGAAVLGNLSGQSAGLGGQESTDLVQNEWIQAVVSSCFHKNEMYVSFICNWIESNLPRILLMTHKYVTHQLTTGWTQAQAQVHSPITTPSPHDLSLTLRGDRFPDDSFFNESKTREVPAEEGGENSEVVTPVLIGPIRKRVTVAGIDPVLLWLLGVSLPSPYSGPLERKPEGFLCPFTKFVSPQQFLRQLMSREEEVAPWSELYDSCEQGTSINRFQYNLYNYKGPTLLFIYADNDYTLCLGSDSEWKESSRFWGGEDSFLLQLQPQFRFIERGSKLLYTNFTIRGYPLGIQVGQDTKNISMEIKPDFQLVSFKGIPCKIFRIVAYGTGSREVKSYQSEYKKWENKQCELQRVIKRTKSEWNENPDKYLLELGGVTNSYARGNN